MLRRSSLSFLLHRRDPLKRHHLCLSSDSITSRDDLRRARRIVIKASTTTVRDSDNFPCLHRITQIIEQISHLRRQKKEIVVVSAGTTLYDESVQRRQNILMQTGSGDFNAKANSVHHRQRALLDSALGHESGSQNILAAMGQSTMMHLYSSLFQQLDTPIGQLLLTPQDFLSKSRVNNINSTISGFMANGVVPIINENGAVKMYKNQGNVDDEAALPFTDNDGLACLIASQIGADLLIFLTDVDGLYDHNDAFIPTWNKNTKIFHPASMKTKVDSANRALALGVPAACICSGQRHGTISNVLDGACEGTLFVHNPEKLAAPTAVQLKKMLAVVEGRQASKGVATSTAEKLAAETAAEQQKQSAAEKQKQDGSDDVSDAIRSQASKAREGGRALLSLGSAERSHVINCVADALAAKTSQILEANEIDVERETKSGKLAAPLLARLKLNEAKLKVLIEGVRSLASSKEPVNRVLSRMQMADGAVLRQETTPIGVITVIFESRPDSLVQIAALALRSCNGLLLKGGKEAVRSNACLHRVIVDAVHEATNGRVPRGVIGLVETRSQIGELLKLDKDIDLVIPRGSNELVRSIQHGTRIPVLGHADGICHTYVDRTCQHLDKAIEIIADAKLQYPAACNATETLLIDSAIAPSDIGRLLISLTEKGIKLRGGPLARAQFPGELGAEPEAESFHIEYGDNQMTVELVENAAAAIQHINKHGSHHTDSILSDDTAVCKQFLNGVDSACVFQNASTRMADGYRFGLGAEVGISTGRIHARGPVGVDGLLSQKWILEVPSVVENITASTFAKGEKEFLHKQLPLDQ